MKHKRSRKIQHIRNWISNNKKLLAGSVLFVSVIAAVLVMLVSKTLQQQKAMQIRANSVVEVGKEYREYIYNGKKYRYNELITTVLVAGVDSEGDMEASAAYSNKARADSIFLVVLDKLNEKTSVLAINRDTMTQIRRYTRTGTDMGLYTSHIGYAYSYGDGGTVSCENLREAVSNLLGGIPIHEYIITNRTSLVSMNELVGGVTVSVPNDDLAEIYPEMKQGAQVKLTEENVEAFIRYRDTSEHFSNEGRMQRQQVYLTAYLELFTEQLSQDLETAWKKIDEMQQILQTSITKSKYISLADVLVKTEFQDENYYVLEGEDQMGDLHDEFYYDEEALQKRIIELFYVDK